MKKIIIPVTSSRNVKPAEPKIRRELQQRSVLTFLIFDQRVILIGAFDQRAQNKPLKLSCCAGCSTRPTNSESASLTSVIETANHLLNAFNGQSVSTDDFSAHQNKQNLFKKRDKIFGISFRHHQHDEILYQNCTEFLKRTP